MCCGRKASSGAQRLRGRLVLVRRRDGLLDRHCCPLNRNLLLLTQAEEPKQGRKVIHLDEVTCKAFIELTREEQGIIMAWLQGYYLPEHEPAAIDVEKLLSDRAKLKEHCINEPEDDLMTAAEAAMEK
jgi:hypothetical protein